MGALMAISGLCWLTLLLPPLEAYLSPYSLAALIVEGLAVTIPHEAHFTRPNYLRNRQDQMKSMKETEEPCLPYESIHLCLRRSQPVSQCRA